LNWTHAGIYIGNGTVVEARFRINGVNQYSIKDWDYPTITYASLLRVITAPSELRYEAAQWAKYQTERDDLPGYHLKWWTKNSSEHSENWYCSELVWASYYNNGINLDDNDDLENSVTPDDLMNSSHTNRIGHHLEIYPIFLEKFLYFHGYCPIDLQITDPDNLVINKTLSKIENVFYLEIDLNKDSNNEDIIIIPYLKYGDYIIEIIMESNASLTDAFSLNVTLGNQTLVLAQDILISDIPSQAYVIHVSEDGISIPEIQDKAFAISSYQLIVFVLSIIGATSLIIVIKRKTTLEFK
jgi:hypothetical protein